MNWSVYANLGNASYDRIQLFLDGSKVYEWGEVKTEDYSRLVFIQHNFKKDLAVSFRGLPAGKHSLELKILREGNLQDSLSQDIDMFEPSTVQIANQAESSINDLKKSLEEFKKSVSSKLSEMDSLNASIEKLNSSISEVQSGLKGTSQSTESLQASVKKIKEDLAGFTEKLRSVSSDISERDANLNASLSELKNSIKDINLQFEEIKKQPTTPLAGFAAFVIERPAIAVGLFLVIIVIIVVLLIRKSSTRSTLFETAPYEPGEETPNAEEIDLGHEEKESDTGKKGRWAFGRENEGESKFHLSDLLWKK